MEQSAASIQPAPASQKALRLDPSAFDLVAIGASTGAPSIIERILKGLPADLSVPILIGQHMPPSFTENFAHRLDLLSPLSVFHAEDGMPLYPGSVYLGVGRRHLRVRRIGSRLYIEISDEPAALAFKPSVDELLKSVSRCVGARGLGIVLSGMGRDGVIGAALLHEIGGTLVTQSAATCSVYGMPRSIDEAQLSDASLDPEQIRQTLLSFSPSRPPA
jgi:two-component system chemotaxis response regulator CheB